jgi:hypothetical protein
MNEPPAGAPIYQRWILSSLRAAAGSYPSGGNHGGGKGTRLHPYSALFRSR